MRTLPKEINHSPKIFFLRFFNFLVFGIIAALERLLIRDGAMAFCSIAFTYGLILTYENFVPSHFVFYFMTKVYHFELEQYDENKRK